MKMEDRKVPRVKKFKYLRPTVQESDSCRRRRHRLKGIHSRPDTNRTGAEGLSFHAAWAVSKSVH